MRRKLHWVLALLSFAFLSACTPVPDAAEQTELLRRWNESAAGISAPFPGGGTTDFKWFVFQQFPHPTYRGGMAEAYQAFADLFLKFFAASGNFEFVKSAGFLDARLVYEFPSGQLGLDTSFLDLSADLGDPNYLPGFISADTRSKMQSLHTRIRDACIETSRSDCVPRAPKP